VTVKDKDGHPIEGLTANDFTVTEDGEPQTVSLLEFERLPTTPVPTETATLSDAPPAAAAGRSSPHAVAVPNASISDVRHASRRLLALYFDLTSMNDQDLARAYNGARKYVTTDMTAADLMAILVFQGGAVRVTQDFTDDRAALLKTLDTLVNGGDTDTNGMSATGEAGMAFGQDDPEFDIFNTDRQLSALQTAIDMLRPLSEQKLLLYFASGLLLNGIDNQAQLRATTNAALRANVSIYAVDARGLVATPPLGDATHASPGGTAMFSGQTGGALTTRFQRSQDTLFALAKDTGGAAMFDNNDLSVGIVNAAQALTSYYILGFDTTHTARDGKFHHVHITVNDSRATSVTYRQGYYADAEFAKFTDADKERQLEQALLLDNPITDLTIALEVNYFQLNRAEYFVPVSVKIPGSELVSARKRGAARTVIDFIGEVKDEMGNTAQNVRDKVDVTLSDQTAAELARRPIQYQTGFTLLPGTYTIKFLARDAETGHIGTFQTTFVIPNLNRETARVPISSVVLSGQRVRPSDALFSVQNKDAEAADPLIVAGQRVVPSVTRVFSKSRNLYVFLQAYERGAIAIEPLAAIVTFYRGDAKVLETPISVVNDGLDPRSKAVPLWFAIPLQSLPTGPYDVQVTIARPADNKAKFWRAPIVIVP
jgi:VWFA-related protein